MRSKRRARQEKQSTPRCILGQTGLQLTIPLVYTTRDTWHSHSPVSARTPHVPWPTSLRLPSSPLGPGLSPPAVSSLGWSAGGSPHVPLRPPRLPCPRLRRGTIRGGRGGSGKAAGPGSPCFPVTSGPRLAARTRESLSAKPGGTQPERGVSNSSGRRRRRKDGGCPGPGHWEPSVGNGSIPERCRGALRGHREEAAGGPTPDGKPGSETQRRRAGPAGRAQPGPQTPATRQHPGRGADPLPTVRREQPATRPWGRAAPRGATEPWGPALPSSTPGCHRAPGTCSAEQAQHPAWAADQAPILQDNGSLPALPPAPSDHGL